MSGGCLHPMTLTTGDPNQLQPIHSYRPSVATTSSLAIVEPTVLAVNAISTAAERNPSSAGTSASLSSASNLSIASVGSIGSSSCSVQSQQQQRNAHPQQQQPHHRTVKYGSSNDPGNNGTDLAAAVRITENPQYLKNKATPGGYHSPPAALNTSLFDSSQRRLLDLTIDSNNIELYDDDDVTNCDQNDDANQSNTSTNNLLSSESSTQPHHHHQQQQQLSVRMRLAPAPESDLEVPECNNNEHQRAGYQSGCLRLSPLHRQHLLNPNSPPCGNHNECDLVDPDEDDLQNLEDLDNSSSLLNESSLSTKPLHQQHTSSWNFRRPIVGPNG